MQATSNQFFCASRVPLQGEMAAMFLRHEGFLGAVGAFLKVHPMRDTRGREARKVRPAGEKRRVFASTRAFA